jgi:glutathione reductase (NADPH)
MTEYDFDLFVIGAGSGGVRAARVAAGHGARVGICEVSRVGGTCVIRGCVPKKLLSYAAHFAEEFEDARGFGWEMPEPVFNWPKLIEAKDREIDRLNRIYLKLLDDAGVRLFEGHGQFVDSHRVQVGDDMISAKRFLVATGGWPWIPNIAGAEHVITSNEAFRLETLPKSILIVGGGFIACEFASIFNGMGSRVHQSYRGPAVLRGFDMDVRYALGREMTVKGIDLKLNTNVLAVEKNEDGSLTAFLDNDEKLVVEQVMYATGRVPNVRGLGLRNTGMRVHPGGTIPVDENSKTSVDHIFAVGDVTNRVNLTPVALAEGHAFADSEFGANRRKACHEFVPSAVFSHPPVATVGFSEEEAGSHFGELDIYRSSFKPLKHTLSGRDELTMMKLVVQRSTGRVVGLHVVGMDAPEIVQGFAVAVRYGLKKRDFDTTIGIHPTAAEELVTLRTPVQN